MKYFKSASLPQQAFWTLMSKTEVLILGPSGGCDAPHMDSGSDKLSDQI